jgi:hypothetical protein
MASGPDHDIAQLNKLVEVTLASALEDRLDIAQRLQARVKALGGDAAQTGGTQRRVAGSGEKHLNEVFQAAVLDTELSDPIRMAIESEFAQIQASRK